MESLGNFQILDRLSYQVGDREKAIDILISRGHMNTDRQTLTQEGIKRNNMTAEERAIDRAVKKQGGHSSQYSFDAKTNKTKKRKPLRI